MNNRVKRKRTTRFAEIDGFAKHKRKLNLMFSAFSGLFRLPVVLSMPIVGYLLLGSIDFLTLLSLGADFDSLLHIPGRPVDENESERYASELVKLKLYIYLYLFISVLVLFNIKVVYQQAFNHKHFAVIFVALLFGYFVSDESAKVLTNVVHLAFGAVSALLFSIGQLGKQKALRNTYLVVLLPILLVQVASVLLLLYQGTEIFGFLSEGKRYAGISGNPNTLGGLCILGIWATMSLIYVSKIKHVVLLLALIALFALGLVLTGSTTSTVVSLIVVAVLLWNMVLRRCTGITRVVLNTLVVFVSVVLALLFVVYIGDNYVELFTGIVGREETFSGRTELWGIARDAIAEKPIFGWSYDSHQSVFGYQKYFVPYNHYHNGYMDTLVAGGFVLGGLLIIHLVKFLWTFRRVSGFNSTVLPLLLPLVILLMSNFTEYSLLRNNNPIWAVYMIAYFVLVTVFTKGEEVIPAVIQRRPSGVKRSRKKHLRF